MDTFYTTHILWIHFIQLKSYGYILYNSHFTDTFYTTHILQIHLIQLNCMNSPTFADVFKLNMYFRKLVDHADISVKESKYQDSMPPFEGLARYIPPLCGDIVVKALTF